MIIAQINMRIKQKYGKIEYQIKIKINLPLRIYSRIVVHTVKNT